MERKRNRVGGGLWPFPHPNPHEWTAQVLFVLATVLLTGAAVSFAIAQPAPDRGRRQVSPVASAGERQSVEQSVAASRPVVRSEVEMEQVAEPARRPSPAKTASAALAPAVGDSRTEIEAESVRIPALGIDQDLVELAVIGNDLQVPDDYADIGWWRDGPVPGQRGAAVMVGHVDSLTGPAVFYRLSGMRPRQRVVVTRTDNSRMVFAVRRVEAYERTHFPSAHVYRSHGAPALHMVTCGGSFDAEAGHYRSNVVVFAKLVDRVPAPHTKSHQEDRQKRHEKGRHHQGNGDDAPHSRRGRYGTPRGYEELTVRERAAQRALGQWGARQ